MNESIKIQYFGSLRLLFQAKEDILPINKYETLESVIIAIDKKYGNFMHKANNLLFFLYPDGKEESCQLKFPKDKDIYIKSGSFLKIFNAMTLG